MSIIHYGGEPQQQTINDQNASIIMKFYMNNFQIGSAYECQIDRDNGGTLKLQELYEFYRNLKDGYLIHILKHHAICKFELNEQILPPETIIKSLKDNQATNQITLDVKIFAEFTVLLLLEDEPQYYFKLTDFNPNVKKERFIQQVLQTYEKNKPYSSKLVWQKIEQQSLYSMLDMILIKKQQNLIKIPLVLASEMIKKNKSNSNSTNFVSSCGSMTEDLITVIDQNNKKFEVYVDYAMELEKDLIEVIKSVAQIQDISNYVFECNGENILWYHPNIKLSELNFIQKDKLIKIIKVDNETYFRITVKVSNIELQNSLPEKASFNDFAKLILKYKGRSDTEDEVSFLLHKDNQQEQIKQLQVKVKTIYNNQIKLEARILSKKYQ